MRSFGNVAREGHALLLLIDRQDGAHQRSFARLDPHTQRKQQAGGRQTFGMLAQVLFVQAEGGATIQFKQDISFRARHQPFRTEGIPTAEGTEADFQPASVQTNSCDGALLRDVAFEHQGLTEARAIASQAAGYRDPLG